MKRWHSSSHGKRSSALKSNQLSIITVNRMQLCLQNVVDDIRSSIYKRNLFTFRVYHWPEVVVVVTRPLPRDGGMAEDHGAPEASQFPRAWTSGRRDRESPNSERRKKSVAGQCRMR